MADVTVMTVCRELQKSQNTSPLNRQAYSPASGGSPASEASPSPAGRRYAASVMPAATSCRSQPRWYARNQVTAGTETLMTSRGSSEVAAV